MTTSRHNKRVLRSDLMAYFFSLVFLFLEVTARVSDIHNNTQSGLLDKGILYFL